MFGSKSHQVMPTLWRCLARDIDCCWLRHIQRGLSTRTVRVIYDMSVIGPVMCSGTTVEHCCCSPAFV